LPPARALLYRQVGRHLERHVVRAPGAAPGQPAPGREPPVPDGDYQQVVPDDLPPPRGSWEQRR
jgi:hypothetical protein